MLNRYEDVSQCNNVRLNIIISMYALTLEKTAVGINKMYNTETGSIRHKRQNEVKQNK